MMTPAPKRRWFRWSLRGLFVAVGLLSAIVWCATVTMRRWNNEFVPVAEIPGDLTMASQIEQELNAKGIEGGCEGSIMYGVMVRRKDSARAKQVLRDFGRRTPSVDLKVY
jgi:hypothetical protein